jgi:hypothetical protein
MPNEKIEKKNKENITFGPNQELPRHSSGPINEGLGPSSKKPEIVAVRDGVVYEELKCDNMRVKEYVDS